MATVFEPGRDREGDREGDRDGEGYREGEGDRDRDGEGEGKHSELSNTPKTPPKPFKARPNAARASSSGTTSSSSSPAGTISTPSTASTPKRKTVGSSPSKSIKPVSSSIGAKNGTIKAKGGGPKNISFSSQGTIGT